MLSVERTDDFDRWLKKLRDAKAVAKILVRIDRLAAGNPGDVAPVGDGISEMRIHYGPGYRVYFVRQGSRVIVLLCGGDKRSQNDDIKRAKTLKNGLED